MWIRSQDGSELFNTDMLQRINVEDNYMYAYTTTIDEDDCNWIRLGVFKTKELAMEEMDIIKYELENGKHFGRNTYSITNYEKESDTM